MSATSAANSDITAAYLAEDISSRLVAATTIILVVTTILLGLRVYARTLPSVTGGLEDVLLLPAYLLSVAACITGYLAVVYGGAGRHVQAIVLEDAHILIVRGKLLYALSWVSAWSNCFSRLSILVLFRRIFTLGIPRICTILLIIYMILFILSQTVVGAVECRPIAAFWDISIKGTCINQFLFYKMSGILNIVGDVAIMALPVHSVWTLHASFARRAGIAAAFLSGSIGIIASCFRTASFFTSVKESMADPTWTDVQLMSWTIVESGMYTAAASIMCLRPLLSKLPAWVRQIGSREGSSVGRWRVSLSEKWQTRSQEPGHQMKYYMGQVHIPLGSSERCLNEGSIETGSASDRV